MAAVGIQSQLFVSFFRLIGYIARAALVPREYAAFDDEYIGYTRFEEVGAAESPDGPAPMIITLYFPFVRSAM